MAVSSTSFTSSNRITGMVSGLDTDSIVKKLMSVERMPLDKLGQKKQLAGWNIEAYRNITNLLRGFKDDYFNVIKPANNMLSQYSYKKFTSISTDSTVVTAVGTVDASSGSHTITVNSVAAAALNQSSAGVTKQVQGSNAANFTTAQGKNFVLTVDGTSRTITVGTDTGVLATNIANLQTAINNAFGVNKVIVSDAGGGKLNFVPQSGSGVNKIALSAGTTDALGALGFTAGDNLSNRLNVGDTLSTIAAKTATAFTFNGSNQLSLTINGKSFTFDKSTTTLSSMMNQINSDATANVTMQYDDVSDAFKFTAKQTGVGGSLKVTETGSTFLTGAKLNSTTGTQTMVPVASMNYSLTNKSFSVFIDGVAKDITLNTDYSANPDYTNLMNDIKTKIQTAFAGTTVSVTQTAGKLSIGLTGGGSTLSVGAPSTGNSALSDLGLTANYTAGVDAKVTLDGQSLTRSSNSFTVGGVTYTLLKQSATQQTVTLNLDTDGIFGNIKKFVDKYNEVISTINAKLSEKYDRNFQPLTDAQKATMKDDDIKKWEDKAKIGLLRDDPILQGVVRDMRKALFDPITGVSKKLTDIGITTGLYQEKGKLIIDETKLRAAIQNNPDDVMNLFSKQSSITTNLNLTQAQRTQRYNEEGLAYRLFDVVEKNVSTFRDNNGKKGILLEKAGVEKDLSEFTNLLYKQITGYDTQISILNRKLSDKENAYYSKFSRLEAALSRMSTQSSWLSSQLGQSK